MEAEKSSLPCNRLPNLRRRVNRVMTFAITCPASRHLHMIAETLAAGKMDPMLHEEPEHCAVTMLSVLESLWKARRELARLKHRRPSVPSAVKNS